MALKDWKIEFQWKPSWYKILKKDYPIHIIYIEVEHQNNEYVVNLDDRLNYKNGGVGGKPSKTLRQFKSKAQALSFAKDYMRKH